ncbi:MAG: hypothetical protein ACOYM5_12345 [Caulobacter sp.]
MAGPARGPVTRAGLLLALTQSWRRAAFEVRPGDNSQAIRPR